ncbi:flagellar basal body rod protein FlgB [Chitinimonas sp. PSY-7]|uniref:flagellar basal body rod protein FlgB n=1 Tax=Chitinimonas sp. PSY-7 TaxID=3459088 RepID=UPI00403FD139
MQATESVTLQLVSKALDAASLRQQAIAANIANVSTAGYRPVRVSFEDQLQVAQSQLNSGGKLDASALVGLQPRLVETGETVTGESNAGLDIQTAELARNAIQYQALLKGLSHHFAMMSTIINEGKR